MLTAEFVSVGGLTANFTAQAWLSVDFDVKVVQGSTFRVYDGEYIVTPKTEEQSLQTKERVAMEDITVKEIPFFEVANATGETIIIGGMNV